eukprot:c16252_g1_i1 orf=252-1190(+)
MGGQLSKHKVVVAEEKQLVQLQEAEGKEFPGSDYHTENYKEWMSVLDLERVKVKDLVWPGTHDSATNKIGVPLVSRPFAQCQSLSIYQQLLKGVRVLDIRVEKERHVCHGILKSYKVDIVINGIKRFLSETKSEFVILEIRTEYGHEDPPEFDKWLIEQLGEYLIHQDNQVFDKTLKELLPKRLICVWKPQKAPAPSHGSPLWSSGYLKDNWIDTDLPYTKFESNMKHLEAHGPAGSRKYFYRVENTVTPQADNVVLCVKPVTNRIRPYARLFLSQSFKKGLSNHIQIFSSDLIDSDFVDACVGLNISRSQN